MAQFALQSLSCMPDRVSASAHWKIQKNGCIECIEHHLALLLKCKRFFQSNLSSLKYQMVTGAKCPIFIQREIGIRISSGHVNAAYSSKWNGWYNINIYLRYNDCVRWNWCGWKTKFNYRFLGCLGNQQAIDGKTA